MRRLAVERVPPTPDNYRAFYHDINGTQAEDDFPERALKLIAAALPRNTPTRLRLANQFEQAIAVRQWASIKHAIVALSESKQADTLPWGHLIRDLLTQLERPLKGVTTAQKRKSLEHALGAPGVVPDLVYKRVQGLIRTWSRNALADDPYGQAVVASAALIDDGEQTVVEAISAATTLVPASAAQLLTYLLHKAIMPIVAENAVLTQEAREIAQAVENLERDPASGIELGARMHALSGKIEWADEDQRAIRQALLNLLKLIIDNISNLVDDDNWLHGQLELVTEVFTSPLDIRMLDEVERRLRDVIDKQVHLKRQLTDAQARLRDMLVGFTDRLAGFSTSTDHYHETLTRGAREIEQADDISMLANVVKEMLSETREVQENAKRSSTELNALRHEVESANHHIVRLQRELDETSELVRHDPLTGVLNRKGLDEALEREISVCRRRSSPLCIALLDIDNFKQLNDTFGHRTGDEALRHLTTVMRESLRPHDLIGRYGGEEFVILLPDTDEEHALSAITRLQRELTKRFFLADNKRLLITFSAGITRLVGDEDPYRAIDRSDKAMYAAKRAGKNRAFLAA